MRKRLAIAVNLFLAESAFHSASSASVGGKGEGMARVFASVMAPIIAHPVGSGESGSEGRQACRSADASTSSAGEGTRSHA